MTLASVSHQQQPSRCIGLKLIPTYRKTLESALMVTYVYNCLVAISWISLRYFNGRMVSSVVHLIDNDC